MHISDVYGGTWSVLLGLPVQSCFHLARNFFVNGRNSYQVEDWWLSMVDMCRFSHPTESISLCTHIVSNNLLDVFLHKSFLCEGSDGPIREYDDASHYWPHFLSFFFLSASSFLLSAPISWYLVCRCSLDIHYSKLVPITFCSWHDRQKNCTVYTDKNEKSLPSLQKSK